MDNTNSPHSPLPWSVVADEQEEYRDGADVMRIAGYNIVSASGREVVGSEGILSGDEGAQNAEFIVTAVNSYAQLTNDLAEAVEALQGMVDLFRSTALLKGWEWSDYAECNRARSILSKHTKEEKQ